MFKLKKLIKDSLQVYELNDGNTVARFVPARGGILTEYTVGDISLLYLDRETLNNPWGIIMI